MKNCLLFILSFVLLTSCSTLSRKQNSTPATEQISDLQESTNEEAPRLVVGIVVDQMRFDYLTRFSSRYTNGGFNRLINDGYQLTNNHYNFVPTYTAPGHASIYTGTSPMNHGIIGNNWYDKFEEEVIYNASDNDYESVGSKSDDGKMSPRRMLTTTVTDQLELHTQGRSKVIGISIKDRGAILPAGHAADAAYWFEGGDAGNFISSTFYMDALPQWVNDFNVSKKANSYLKTWNTLYPINSYVASGNDLNEFEKPPRGKENATFPYDLNLLRQRNGNFNLLKATPFGNTIVADFAIEALKKEALGKDNITDFLAVSFSSTDYIGHQYGVNSIEIEDTYLRLDLEIERLLKALDQEVGKNNYTVFLTADHGAVNNPAYLQSNKINAGYFERSAFQSQLENDLQSKYGAIDLISNISNGQIFLDRKTLVDNNLDAAAVEDFIAYTIIDYKHIDKVYTRNALMAGAMQDGTGKLIQNGFHHKRSGDVIYVLEPAVISYSKTGSTHGSSQSYDTHVPLLFYGNGIQKGSSNQRTEIIDIAPTISSLLGISFPNGATGNPIKEVLKN
ncbi:putative AlkP superfamily pyrophosphatase or phosphodiesterase [Nonlabens dokdonensis]|uniref:Alkaline phosphatase n=2 Tax=Nonlabens dokdonensis TaxID=328515 RepID=L7W1P9_NONDD|nr:alkaline phosphatase PafA [Nonlabens dokdonensis]AGC75400.1 alkaline phosphatase [Nonlabens dokdonensis DSW-6]PZX43099.1 putative AlkP superfamily pyrophosphatase or phosphodiesterase [Nonlabens dokdonensis]